MMVPGRRRGLGPTPRHDRHPRPDRLGLLRSGRQLRRPAHRSPVLPVPRDRLGRHRVVGVPRPLACGRPASRRRSSSPACSRSPPRCSSCRSRSCTGRSGRRRRSPRPSERDLTETALEASATHEACPSCGSPVEDGWRLCPFCRYELLVPCPRCTKPVEMAWSICPWCVTELPWAREPVGVFAEPPAEEPPLVWPDWGGGSDAGPAAGRTPPRPSRPRSRSGRSPATPL